MESKNILLVEDNPGDVDLIAYALSDSSVPHRLSVASDGLQALAFLRRPATCVHLILLDLNLPGMDGREVLRQVKMDEALRHLPVVVVSSSSADIDLLETYRLHANCYITKRIDVYEFFSLIKDLGTFWLTRAHLPPQLD